MTDFMTNNRTYTTVVNGVVCLQCILYTFDGDDDVAWVDFGGGGVIKKKKIKIKVRRGRRE